VGVLLVHKNETEMNAEKLIYLCHIFWVIFCVRCLLRAVGRWRSLEMGRCIFWQNVRIKLVSCQSWIICKWCHIHKH